jgi:Bacterial regulatory protein, arsR family
VRRDLLATHAPDPVPNELQRATRPGDRPTLKLLDAICDALECHWNNSLAPSWPQMQLVLEADTTYRARQLATGGAGQLFADIHPNLSWHEGVLSITEMISHDTVAAAGRGLLLVPSIFAYKPVPPLDPDEPPSLGYPSRGIATLWAPPPQPRPGALVDLLGRTRALLLQMLEEPLPTVELARRLKVTPSAVSQHLQVLYRRTPTGDQLTTTKETDPSGPEPDISSGA